MIQQQINVYKEITKHFKSLARAQPTELEQLEGCLFKTRAKRGSPRLTNPSRAQPPSAWTNQ